MVAPLEFFKALGVAIVIVVLVLWILWIIVYSLTKIARRLRYLFKKWEEKDVAWCMDAIGKGLNEDQVIKHLLVTGHPNRVKDMVYLFNQCKRKSEKGGKGKDE